MKRKALSKPSPVDVALAKILEPGSGFRRSAVEAAEATMRERARINFLSLGEHTEAAMRAVRRG